MSDKLPALYWYVFWLVCVLGCLAYGFVAAAMQHRRNMKALDVLKQYAEQGQEPPPIIAERLAGQILSSEGGATKRGASPADRRDELLRSFIGFLFMACLAWGLKLWLVDSGSARWAIGASEAARAFFGFGSFGLLLAALLTRKS
jgi:hypothetical protein